MTDTDVAPSENDYLFLELPWWMKEVSDLIIDEALRSAGLTPDTQQMFDMRNGRAEFLTKTFAEITPKSKVTELRKALIFLGSAARIQYIIEHHEQMPVRTIRALLPDYWTSPNMAFGGPTRFTSDLVRTLFARTGFLMAGDTATEPESDHVNLYHGTPSGTISYKDWEGFAWTTDIEVARRFAGLGAIWSGIAHTRDVLARFDNRGESEWVIDPMNVSHKTIVKDYSEVAQ